LQKFYFIWIRDGWSFKIFAGFFFEKNLGNYQIKWAVCWCPFTFTFFFLTGTWSILFFYCRGRLKSPWSRRKRKHALTPRQWKSLFTPDGKLRDGGVKFLKKVRSGVSNHSNYNLCFAMAVSWEYLSLMFLL
jgi:hypothetical protein